MDLHLAIKVALTVSLAFVIIDSWSRAVTASLRSIYLDRQPVDKSFKDAATRASGRATLSAIFWTAWPIILVVQVWVFL